MILNILIVLQLSGLSFSKNYDCNFFLAESLLLYMAANSRHRRWVEYFDPKS